MPLSIKYIEAKQFVRKMTSGRTSPCLFLCSTDTGSQKDQYVVKFRKNSQGSEYGLACELIASLLAQGLQIPVPEPAVILINQELAEGVTEPTVKNLISNNVGYNFGTKVITEGYSLWLPNFPIPPQLKVKASEILTFDALIQNPDRRVYNSNILWKGEDIFVIDHEMAFSFLFDISNSRNPWEGDAFFSCIKEHVFYRQLKGKSLDLDRFINVLKTINVAEMSSLLPHEWHFEAVNKVFDHISVMIKKTDIFIENLRRVMA